MRRKRKEKIVMSEEKTITLKKPVSFDGQTVETLRMRFPKVKDQLKAETSKGTDAEKEVMLISELCSSSIEMIKELSLSDYRQLQEAFKDFLE
ncbi:MAG: phage tail assembly protein [Nitrospirae bacterium]|nr:phage tail assembly protein [Nitrospirota bacterium]